MELLLCSGAKTCGLNPVEILCYIEESVTSDEYEAIQKFLKWLVSNKKTYGRNIQSVWEEWQQSR